MNTRAAKEKAAFDSGLHAGVARFQHVFRVANEASLKNRAQFIRAEMHRANGKDVLEIGSSSWVSWLDGVHPKSLTCINIAQTDLEYGRSFPASFPIDFRLMDAHRLDFPAESFDVVFGSAILHHLDLPVALQEIHRVLRPGGSIAFFEPLGINPASKLIRKLSPQARTVDERPIDMRDLRLIESLFETHHRYDQLFQVPLAIMSALVTENPESGLCRLGGAIDRAILPLRVFNPLFRYIFIAGTVKRSTAP